MPLVPAIEKILSNAPASADPPPETLLDEQAAREYAAALRAGTSAPPPSIEVANVEDRTLADRFTVRLYDDGGEGLRPGVVYLHGGGWALGDLDYQDAVCRRLATVAGAVVVNVDYRLAPEHRFPAALDDSYDATVWLVEHAAELGVDPARVAVMGSSSGANLAAAVALRARDSGGPALVLQVLVYPPLDSELSSDTYRTNGGGEYLLSTAQMSWFWQQYAHRPEDRVHPWASPRHATDLAGLPPAIVDTAEYDPLRDDGEEYAARLREAGVDTELRRQAGLIHGYVGLTATVPEAAVASVVERVRARLHA